MSEFTGLFEFMTKKEILLELTVEELKNFVKLNICRDADVEVRNGRLYILLPLEVMIPYDIKDNRVILKLPAR